MTVSLNVTPLRDSQEISFVAIELSHVECAGPPFYGRRQRTSGHYTLRCDCGLQIVLSAKSVSQITKVAIGAEATRLSPGTFSCDPPEGAVYAIPRP